MKKQKKPEEMFVIPRANVMMNQKVAKFAHRNTKRAKTRAAQKARALTDW
jgi:hypothetical protein